ncbi:methyl-accepting chemotaxis protein [Verrucomicrobium sp. BvORR106]|uniref:methyl-accepting chemotaxis protein n=1 Tax=Verrucomicrobium sp. BvORR106 TaxID=1403819 RepID=UPI00068F8CD4|nr:methyl-accepting chemotaxis protein [Verrucomicrobium sp. BvORR106]
MIRFRDVPIKRKLMLGVLLSSTASLLLASLAYVAYERATYRADQTRTLTILADVLAANSTATLSLSEATDTKGEAEEILSALSAEPDIVSAALYGADGKLFATFLRERGEPPSATAPTDETTVFSGNRIILPRPVTLGGKRIGTICLVADTQRINAHLRRYVEIGAVVLAASMLLTAFLATIFQRIISRPILALASAAQQVADKKDYSVRAERFGGDELGKFTDVFNQMLTAIDRQSSELKTALKEIDEKRFALVSANEAMHTQTTQITESVDVLGYSAREILNFTTQASATASQTATAITETTATVEEVRQTVHLSSEKARNVVESSQKSAQISEIGRKSAGSSVEGMNRIRQQMEAIAESMVRLSDQTQDIGQIVTAVEDLAAQSNLLAVNAAIEAAKAGEQGRGFAVVAQEVRSLAEQSRQATTQVRAILKDIQNATSAAVMATEMGTKAVDAGVQQSTQAGEAIVALTESVKQAAQAAEQISASTQQQLVGMDHVATAMESVKQASGQNVESARHLEAAARRLNEMGEKLQHMASQSAAPALVLPKPVTGPPSNGV